MNQKGFANIILVVVVIVILVGAVAYFALVKKSSPLTQEPTPIQITNTSKPSLSPSKLLTYSNEELHISFQYPDSFKVYNASKDELRVESDYKKEGAPGASIGMNITRINAQRETDDQINFRLQGKKIIKDENRNGYRILQFEGGYQYYVLSDKGTFYIGDSLNIYKDSLSQEQFTDYRKKFDTIMGSIIIK